MASHSVTGYCSHRHHAESTTDDHNCNYDTTVTSALLNRLLHHADTCVAEGRSYREKGHIPEA